MVPFYMWRLWSAARRHRHLRGIYAQELEEELMALKAPEIEMEYGD